jgi:hypothetical protein
MEENEKVTERDKRENVKRTFVPFLPITEREGERQRQRRDRQTARERDRKTITRESARKREGKWKKQPNERQHKNSLPPVLCS